MYIEYTHNSKHVCEVGSTKIIDPLFSLFIKVL